MKSGGGNVCFQAVRDAYCGLRWRDVQGTFFGGEWWFLQIRHGAVGLLTLRRSDGWVFVRQEVESQATAAVVRGILRCVLENVMQHTFYLRLFVCDDILLHACREMCPMCDENAERQKVVIEMSECPEPWLERVKAEMTASEVAKRPDAPA